MISFSTDYVIYYYYSTSLAFPDECDPETVHDFVSASSQSGWLCWETLVELKLFEERAVHLWRRKHQDRALSIKLTPVDVDVALGMRMGSTDSMLEESVDVTEVRERKKAWPSITVAVSICRSKQKKDL